MSGRMVRIELRRSSVLVTGAVIFALPVAAFYLVGWGPWQKTTGAWYLQWDSFVYYLRSLYVVLVPAALAGGAVLGMRDRRCGVGELFSTAPRPGWQRPAQSAAALGVAVSVAFVAVLVAGGVAVVANGAFFHPGWLLVAAVGALSLVAAGWLGMATGRLIPSPLTPPVLAAAGFTALNYVRFSRGAAEYDVPRASVLELLTPVLAGTTRNAFLTVSASVSLAQLAWFAGLALTALGLLTASRLRLVMVLPAVLGLAVALIVLPHDMNAVYVLNPQAAQRVCTETGDVCVTRAHAGRLPALVGPARDALSRLGRLPDAPRAIEELPTPGMDKSKRPEPPGVQPVDFDELDFADPSGRGLTGDQLRTELLGGIDPGRCEAWNDEKSLAARTIVASWLLGEPAALRDAERFQRDIADLTEPAWRTLQALPPETQPQTVAALRKATRTCDPDPLSVLSAPR